MLDPRTLYNANTDVFDDAGLKGLPLLMSLTGFMDAGHVIEQVSEELLEVLEHETVVSSTRTSSWTIAAGARRSPSWRTTSRITSRTGWNCTGCSTGSGSPSCFSPVLSPTCNGSVSSAP